MTNDKNYYRSLFREYKKYLKLSAFAEDLGIARSTLSRFMQSETNNYMISVQKLEVLNSYILNKFS